MDEPYIDRVLAGDREAFRYFIETYKDMAYTLAVSIIKDDQYAEEAVQDAFVKAFAGMKAYNRTATFKSWFYRIVVNECFMRLKKMQRRVPVAELDAADRAATFQPADQDGGQLELVKTAIAQLVPKEALVMNLFYLEGYSLKEITQITNWSLANAKVLLHRARKHVKESVNKAQTTNFE